MVKAVYPGTFDPVHNGHIDITTRASTLFDEVVVGVYEESSKALMFSTSERVSLFSQSLEHLSNVRVVSFTGLAPEFARSMDARFILRGLRAGFDFELEFEMALMWRSLAPDIDVVCLMSALSYQFVYSSRIKEVANLGGDMSELVPPAVVAALNRKARPSE